MITYYEYDGGYIAVTDESPAGFEGLVFVGRGGPIDAIEDQLFPAEVLTDPADVHDVPPEWCAALGYHAVEDFPLLDEEGENLVAEVPVREQIDPSSVRPVGSVGSAAYRFLDEYATAIGFVIGGLIFLLLLRL